MKPIIVSLYFVESVLCRVIPDEFKLDIYVRIVRLLLEEDDAVTAESFFNRATLLIHGTLNKTTQREPSVPASPKLRWTHAW